VESTQFIARMTTGGTITEFAVPRANSEPSAAATGPDGTIWFTEENGDAIGRFTLNASSKSPLVPLGVDCIVATAAGPTTATFSFEVVPEANAAFLLSAPLGSDTFTAQAYAVPCGEVTGNTTPAHTSTSATAVVASGAPAAVSLTSSP
jgi:hypothetical protein